MLFWLVMLAGVCASTAWGDTDRRDRDDWNDRRDRVDRRTRDAELDFMRRTIDFEAAAVKVARAAQDRTRHAELRDYLAKLERQGNRRIDRLQSMMQNSYDRRYEPRVDPKYEQRAEMFRSSDMSSDEYEIRLLKTLIDLNQEESIMAERYRSRLSQSDLREMAGTVLNRRSDVAGQLQGWLKRWYDISYTSDAELERGGGRDR